MFINDNLFIKLVNLAPKFSGSYNFFKHYEYFINQSKCKPHLFISTPQCVTEPAYFLSQNTNSDF